MLICLGVPLRSTGSYPFGVLLSLLRHDGDSTLIALRRQCCKREGSILDRHAGAGSLLLWVFWEVLLLQVHAAAGSRQCCPEATCHIVKVALLVLLQAQARLQVLERQPRLAEVAVIGAGYAGVELATTVQERLGRRGQVKLITAGGYLGWLKLLRYPPTLLSDSTYQACATV